MWSAAAPPASAGVAYVTLFGVVDAGYRSIADRSIRCVTTVPGPSRLMGGRMPDPGAHAPE